MTGIVSSQNISGKNLKSIRQFRGLSQAKLGEALGRDRRFIQRVEKGGVLDARFLEPLAIALDLADPFLLTREIVDVNRLSSLGMVKKSRK